MSQQPAPLDIRIGAFYSNGAYGRAWGVRQVIRLDQDPERSLVNVHFKGMAGTCRRKQGHCSLEAFLAWTRYEVALNENSWQRIAGPELAQ